MTREFWLYEAMADAGLSHGDENDDHLTASDEAWGNLEGEVLD